ncbi:MAG: T9SS type B sorting domain-containing protein [Polaribacter sp.]|nr:T9SS type B sorting domain-containing protein [Polaribacter sp.]
MKIYSTLLFLLLTVCISAQREADNWYFGNNAGLNFSTSMPTVIQGSSIFSTKGSSAISDKNGNTVFYSNGTFLKNDKNFDIATTFGGSNGGLTQSAIFIPTNNEHIYHYFTISIESQSPGPGGPNFAPGLYHYMLDKRLNNGNGGVIPQRDSHLINTGGMSGKMSAIHHSDGKSIWLAVLGNETNLNNSFDTFFIYKINETDVSNPIIYKLETPLDYGDGAIKFSPDGEKLVLTGYERKVILFEFNKQDASIKKENEFGTFVDLGVWAIPYGVEFSQDSKLLYLTGVDQNSLTYLFQFDIEETDLNKIRTELYTDNSIIPGGLQISSDGKIYMAIAQKSQVNNQSSYLGVINSPTTIGIRSNYDHNAINLEEGKSIRSLPNFIQSYFRTRILTEKGCLNSDIFFEVDTYANITSAEWDFGDGNKSTEITPNHIFTTSGEFNVTVTITINNRQITVNKKITVFSPPIIYTDKKIIQCGINNDGIDYFNLMNINDEITDNNLTYEFAFFENSIDAFNNSNKIDDPENYQNLSNPQTLFARIVNQNGCSSIAAFSIESVFVQLGNINSIYTCEDSDNIIGNSEGLFKLRGKLEEIREQFNISSTSIIRFYKSQIDAQTTNDQLPLNFNSPTRIIWVRVDNDLSCGGIEPVNLIVNSNQPINLQDTYTICHKPEEKPPVIVSADASNDRFEWKNSTGAVISTEKDYTLNTIGEFSLTVYKSENGIACSVRKDFVVVNPEIAVFSQIDVNTEDETNNTISLNVIGNSNYEFSLDNTNFSGNGTSFTFTNVEAGLRTVYVRDINNCEEPIQTNVSVIGFKEYFTPNGDNNNDFWNVKGLDPVLFKSINVRIFNRYGKLIGSITDFSSQGWDGNFNGKPAAPNNYWFTAKIIDKDDKIIQESGNFSLIRN